MKKLISNYTFNPTARTITFNDYSSVDLQGLLLVTNVTSNQIIYNFADPCYGGGVNGNTVTLVYNTGAMSSTDALQIYYDDVNETPATEQTLQAIEYQNNRLLKISESLATVDVNQRQRVVVDAAVVTNQVTVNGANSNFKPVDNNNQAVYVPGGNSFGGFYNAVPDIWRTIDTARLTYQQAIRSNLTF